MSSISRPLSNQCHESPACEITPEGCYRDTDPAPPPPDTTPDGFDALCEIRWRIGKIEYGDRSFGLSTHDLLEEGQQECADIPNYNRIILSSRAVPEEVASSMRAADHYARRAWVELQRAKDLLGGVR